MARLSNEIAEVEEVNEIPGKGVVARVEGHLVVLGSRSLVEEHAGGLPPGNPCEGPVVYAAVDGAYVASFCLEEELDPGAERVVETLKNMGLRVVVASGDSSSSVRMIAERLGIDYYGGLRPHEKKRLVENLRREGPVLVAGDGVNDIPMLAASDVGVAMARIALVARSADAVSTRGAPGPARPAPRIQDLSGLPLHWACSRHAAKAGSNCGGLSGRHLPPPSASPRR
ncbi:hypothetical protein CF15_06825 [Pyrodictium occultum]|uniref:Uncharacterized protein n=1 Tax=Pyrodictium occultum TaxID=2309 RepID=A0A0V8RWS9_PYROC|nr:hypothetical protein CF15_06825 [Pyrodictium occultum]